MTDSSQAVIYGLVALSIILAATGRLNDTELQTTLCAIVALERFMPKKIR